MDPIVLQLAVYGIFAAAGNVLGGAILLPSGFHSRLRTVLRYILALGAGFMLSVTIFEMFPRSLALWATEQFSAEGLAMSMGLILGGYLLTQFFEHTVAPHVHLGEEMHCDDHDHALVRPRVAYAAVGGLLVHTFFDGVSIAAATQLDTRLGMLVFAAVLLHKLPEGFTIGSMVLAAGKGRKQVLASTALVGAMTLIGVFVFYFVGTRIGFTVNYALPLATGVTLYVAASDLIPEVNHHGGKNPLVSLSVFAGVGLFFASHFLLHSILGD